VPVGAGRWVNDAMPKNDRDFPLWLLVLAALVVVLLAMAVAYSAFKIPWGFMD
jgi:hypothetical protein